MAFPVDTNFWNNTQIGGGIVEGAKSLFNSSDFLGALDNLTGPIQAAARRSGDKFIFENISWQSPNSFKIEFFKKHPAVDIGAFRAVGLFVESLGPISPSPTNVIPQLSTSPQSNNVKTKESLYPIIPRFHLRSFTVPMPKFEYEPLNYTKRVKNITHPDSVTFTLLEDEYGTLRQFIDSWYKSIAFKAANGQFIFYENQIEQEMNAVIHLQTNNAMNTPAYSKGWVLFSGVKLESASDVSISHDSKEFLQFEITCALDNVWFVAPK